MADVKTVFDHTNSIYTDKSSNYYDELSGRNKSSYSQYMINRIISMNANYLPLANMIQKYGKLPNKMHFIFLAEMTPSGKQYNKYIKATKSKYPDWLINLIQSHYGASLQTAIEYLTIYFISKENFAGLGILCNKYAIEQKEINMLQKLMETD